MTSVQLLLSKLQTCMTKHLRTLFWDIPAQSWWDVTNSAATQGFFQRRCRLKQVLGQQFFFVFPYKFPISNVTTVYCKNELPSPLEQKGLVQKSIAWIALYTSAFKNSVTSISVSMQDSCKYLLLCSLKPDDLCRDRRACATLLRDTRATYCLFPGLRENLNN